MEVLLNILKWFKGGKISLTVKGIEIGIEIGTDGTAKISAAGDIDDLVNFIKELKGDEKK